LKSLVTLCVTTFKRPDALASLLGSIAQYYPDLRQVVVDTKGNLSWGRNYAIKQCMTPFIMLLEDDFVFTEKTNIRLLLQILQEDKELGGVGGSVNDVHTANDFDELRGVLNQKPANRFRENKYSQQYAVCDYTDNFGLYRREMFNTHVWDETLELHEHINFYYGIHATKKWRIAVAKDVDIKHVRPKPSQDYRQYRKRNFVSKAQKNLGLTFGVTKGCFIWPAESSQQLVPFKEDLEDSASTVEPPSL